MQDAPRAPHPPGPFRRATSEQLPRRWSAKRLLRVHHTVFSMSVGASLRRRHETCFALGPGDELKLWKLCAEEAAARALCIQWGKDAFKFDCKVDP